MLLGIANSVNRDTERKSVLNDANQDSISFPSVVSLVTEIVITINVLNFSSTRILLSDGTVANSIGLQTNGSVTLTTVGGGTATPASELNIGVNAIKVRRDGAVNRLSVNGGSEFSSLADTFEFNIFAERLGAYFDNEVIKCVVDGETFLNSGNGRFIVGDLGTILTRQTNHLNGLNYINHEMIKLV